MALEPEHNLKIFFELVQVVFILRVHSFHTDNKGVLK